MIDFRGNTKSTSCVCITPTPSGIIFLKPHTPSCFIPHLNDHPSCSFALWGTITAVYESTSQNDITLNCMCDNVTRTNQHKKVWHTIRFEFRFGFRVDSTRARIWTFLVLFSFVISVLCALFLSTQTVLMTCLGSVYRQQEETDRVRERLREACTLAHSLSRSCLFPPSYSSSVFPQLAHTSITHPQHTHTLSPLSACHSDCVFFFKKKKN